MKKWLGMAVAHGCIRMYPDDQGQTLQPNLELLSQQLDRALGKATAAIHWDFAREALEAATGMPTVVGLEATVMQ